VDTAGEGLISKKAMTTKLPTFVGMAGLPGLRSAPAPTKTTPLSSLKMVAGSVPQSNVGGSSATVSTPGVIRPSSPSASKSNSEQRDRDSGSGSSRRGSAQEPKRPSAQRDDRIPLFSGGRDRRDYSEEDRYNSGGRRLSSGSGGGNRSVSSGGIVRAGSGQGWSVGDMRDRNRRDRDRNDQPRDSRDRDSRDSRENNRDNRGNRDNRDCGDSRDSRESRDRGRDRR
jgi:transcription termination factor Rho